MEVFIGLGVMILGSFGSLWYKIGKLTTEVKHHNQLLQDIEKRIDNLITR